MPTSPRLCALHWLLAGLSLTASGCFAPPLGVQLVGRWEGVPDTAVLRAERAAATTEASIVSPPAPNAEATDLEAFQFRIMLDLAAAGGLEMTLDGVRKLKGRWRVVSRFGDRAVIELATAGSGGEEQRRFDLRLGPGAEWFTLREEGADPQFGQLYFRRGATPPPGAI